MFCKFKHWGIKDASSPYDFSMKLHENSRRIIAQLNYASAMGSLMYVMDSTRIDFAKAFPVCKHSRYTHKPDVEH